MSLLKLRAWLTTPQPGIGSTHSAVGKRGGSRARARPKGRPAQAAARRPICRPRGPLGYHAELSSDRRGPDSQTKRSSAQDLPLAGGVPGAVALRPGDPQQSFLSRDLPGLRPTPRSKTVNPICHSLRLPLILSLKFPPVRLRGPYRSFASTSRNHLSLAPRDSETRHSLRSRIPIYDYPSLPTYRVMRLTLRPSPQYCVLEYDCPSSSHILASRDHIPNVSRSEL